MRLHIPLTWPVGFAWLALVLAIGVASAVYRRQQRRAMWALVLSNAHRWAESVGGKVKRVSEQPSVYGPRGDLIAQRYRVTFADRGGDECVATLRYTVADGNCSLERLGRETAPDPAAAPSAAALSAESHARRHRGRTSDAPVIFAAPRRRRPPRRST